MFRVVELDVGIAEMEFDAAAQGRVSCAPLQLHKRVVLERIKAAEYTKPLRKEARLCRNPIVLGPDPRVFVFHSSGRATIHVGHRQQESSTNASRIQQWN